MKIKNNKKRIKIFELIMLVST